jgi:hypothetical protein
MNAFEQCLNATSARQSTCKFVGEGDKEVARLMASAMILNALTGPKMAYPSAIAKLHSE